MVPGSRLESSGGIAAKSFWVNTRSACACPECIAEDRGAWQLQWLLPWSFACLRHNLVLPQHCPKCRQPLRSNISARPNAFSLASGIPVTGCCENRLGFGEKVESTDSKCGFELAQMQAISLVEWSALIAAQQRLNDAMEGKTMKVGGQAVSSVDYLKDIRVISKLLLFASDMKLLENLPGEMANYIEMLFADYQLQYSKSQVTPDFKRGGQLCEPYLAYRDNAVMAAILPTATHIAASSDSSELAAHLDELLSYVYRRSRPYSTRAKSLLASKIFSNRLRLLILKAIGVSVVAEEIHLRLKLGSV